MPESTATPDPATARQIWESLTPAQRTIMGKLADGEAFHDLTWSRRFTANVARLRDAGLVRDIGGRGVLHNGIMLTDLGGMTLRARRSGHEDTEASVWLGLTERERVTLRMTCRMPVLHVGEETASLLLRGLVEAIPADDDMPAELVRATDLGRAVAAAGREVGRG